MDIGTGSNDNKLSRKGDKSHLEEMSKLKDLIEKNPIAMN